MMKRTALLSALISAGLCSSAAMAEVTMNGFATVAAGISDQEISSSSYSGYNKDIETTPDSLVALQFGYEINDKMNATIQLMAKGEDNWDPTIEWAYLSYQTDQGTLLRAGKLRLPFYMYSDYLDVRYAQPFLRPNTEVYGLVAFTSYTGVDAVIPIEAGESQFVLQPFFGTVDYYNEQLDADFSLKNLLGANLSWEWDSLLLRAIYAQGELVTDETDPGLITLLHEKTGTFIGVGFKYEPGDFFLLGEVGRREVDDQFSDEDAGYLATGYRFGEVTPYLMYGITETQDDDERTGIYTGYSGLNNKRSSVSLGMRWDVMPSVAFKADLTHYDDFLDDETDNNGDKLEDANVFTISVDTVF